MSFIATHGKPGVGYLPLRHRGFRRQGWDEHQRAGIHCVEVTGRADTGEGLGNWNEDPEKRGDLNGGNHWLTDRNARPISGWAFAWPATLTATGAPEGLTQSLQARRSTRNAALPMADGKAVDNRYTPKPVVVPARFGKPGADPKKARRAAAQQAAQQGQRGTLFLGIGAQVVPVTGGAFPSFSGVRTNFGGSSFPTFSQPPGFGTGRS